MCDGGGEGRGDAHVPCLRDLGNTGNFHIFQSPTKLPGVCENSIGNFIALPLTLPRLLVPSAGCESGSVYFPCNCPPTSGWWWFSARFSRSMWAVLHLLLYYPSWCPLVFATSCPQDMYPSFLGGGGYWKMSQCEFCRWTFFTVPRLPTWRLIINYRCSTNSSGFLLTDSYILN